MASLLRCINKENIMPSSTLDVLPMMAPVPVRLSPSKASHSTLTTSFAPTYTPMSRRPTNWMSLYQNRNHMLRQNFKFIRLCWDNTLIEAMNFYAEQPEIDISFNNNEAMKAACENSNIVFMNWLFNIHPIHTISCEVVEKVCAKGDLKVLRWMHQMKLLCDIPMKVAYFLAVKNGHMEMTNWIIDEFGL